MKNIEHPINAIGLDDINNDREFNVVSFGSEHVGGCHFVYADNSIRFLSENIELKIYQAMSTRDGGETIELP